MRIALAANGQMGLALFRAARAAGHEVVALVRDGRSGTTAERWIDEAVGVAIGPWSVEGAALLARVPFLRLRDQGDRDVRRLAACRPDLLLTGNFGMILRPSVLAVPAVGCVNVHWSLLPQHRGPNPSTSVLLSGDSRTGVTFHAMTARIDAGDILDQVAFPVGPDATATSLYLRAVREAEQRLPHVLARVERDGVVGRPQDLAAGSYWRRPGLRTAWLDFERPAADLDRLVRALVSPLPRTSFRGWPVYVTAARRVSGASGTPGHVLEVRPRVVVACGTEALAIDRAWTTAPPLPWPTPLSRLSVGDRLGERDPVLDRSGGSG